jgi:hypothetical protein
VAAVLLSEVATSDLAKLTRVLDPISDSNNSRVLDSLLRMAVHEVANGNAERAVGYLADYATRDPRRAEALQQEPGLAPVRDKIDSMVTRMTVVAKMSAEDSLSHAEQTSSELVGKLPDWETNADVILKMAHRFFEAGGYANYSRTTELARVVTDAAAAVRPVAQVLAASASASSTQAMPTDPAANQLVPGINVPYWTSPDFPLNAPFHNTRIKPSRRTSSSAWGDIRQNMQDLKEISSTAIRQLWRRAPLLVMMLTWFALGLAGGFVFAIASHIWPGGLLTAIGNLSFATWGIGFLALVGFGFFVRVHNRPLR